MKKVQLGSYVMIKTGKLDANASDDNGLYPFFTCARKPLKINTFAYDCECVLVAGNGDLNAKYFNGKFNAYQRTYIIEVKYKEILDTKYLYYFMSSYVEKLRKLSIGGVIKYIKLNNLTDVVIPMPDLTIQKEIVNIIEKAEYLLDQRRQSIQKLDDLLQSVFYDMFGDTSDNKNNFPKINIGKITKVSSGSTPNRNHGEYYGGSIPWVKTTEVKWEVIKQTEESLTELGLQNSSCRLYPTNSVVVAMYGQGKTRGKVGILGIPATTNQACAVIYPSNSITYQYVFSYLRYSYELLRGMGRGGNQPNLNVGMIANLEIPIPPIDLQDKYSDIFNKINSQKELLQTNAKEMNNLFQSILHQSFNT